MNRPVKTLLRVGGLVVGIGAVVWALKDRLLPAPQIPEEPPPRFRGGATSPETTSGNESAADESAPATDDLTVIKGIGPAYADRLRSAGFTSLAALAGATPAAVSAAGRVSEGVAATWIERAADLA